MDDLISRQAAIDALQKEINKGIPPFDDVMGSIRCGVRLARNIIEDLPSAQPETHDKRTETRACDSISRQAAVDELIAMREHIDAGMSIVGHTAYDMAIEALRQPEIIRCKDYRWWDKYGDYDNGYCMAAKHGYWSEHWDISIRRTYKGDFYCADAEPKGEQE